VSGSNSGSLALTNDNLNAGAPSYAIQMIMLSGTGTGQAPAVTQNPSSQTVTAGATATFTAAASGIPTPTVQWQVSSGGAFSNIAGATSTTLSFATTASQNGYQYRAVFTNSVSTAITTAATLTIEDFTISASPNSQTISSGHSAVYTVSLTSLRGLTGNVALTCSGAPVHSTCTISPTSVMLNKTLNSTATTTVNLFASQSVNHGTFTLTFTGTLGNISHSYQVSLTVE
jgi:hypothetical protein